MGRVGRERCGFGGDFQAQVQPAQRCFGDFQANGIFPLAKRLGRKPRELAQQLVDALGTAGGFLSEKAEFTVAGGGFVNVTLSPEALGEWLGEFSGEDALRAEAGREGGRRVLVDYSSPNSAKQMHVGHLRSLVIGDAIANILTFFGDNVLRDNHLGDWGTQFGILLMQIRREGIDLGAGEGEDAIEVLENLYRRGVRAVETSEEALEEARRELVALQNGDPERLRQWERINELSYATFREIYDLAGVRFDYVLGESFDRNQVGAICRELEGCGVARRDGGALLVFFPEGSRYTGQPYLICKSDGASNYATTDLAAVLYRVEELHADRIIYVTDGRQQDHFQMLFLTVGRWFAATHRSLPDMQHAWFGTVCGEDGKAIRTRDGESIRLRQLFSEAIDRAEKIVDEKSSQLDGELRKKIARAVGIGAIKYGDLCQNRSSDYTFSWDKMLAFEGNTAPYLQYAAARIQAIFRRWGEFEEGGSHGPKTEEEISLARRLILFPVALRQARDELRPHLLCTYLFELASEFSAFYAANRILGEAADIAQRRLILCARTLLFLRLGMSLLGIETLEQM
jgi:arginyl-tRNA synthetase